jgi:hypothetical protein
VDRGVPDCDPARARTSEAQGEGKPDRFYVDKNARNNGKMAVSKTSIMYRTQNLSGLPPDSKLLFDGISSEVGDQEQPVVYSAGKDLP